MNLRLCSVVTKNKNLKHILFETVQTVKIRSKGRGCFWRWPTRFWNTLKTVNYIADFVLWFVRNTIQMFHLLTVFEELTLCSIEITLNTVMYIYGLIPELVNTVKTFKYSQKMLVHLHVTISPDLWKSFNKWSMFLRLSFLHTHHTKTPQKVRLDLNNMWKINVFSHSNLQFVFTIFVSAKRNLRKMITGGAVT